jgi:AcrR family transcriptional regulator
MATAVSREAVVEAARRAAANGRQPTMEEIAAAAGVSLRTLYRLFGSRQALLGEVDWEPPPSARERILEAALELVGRHGLAELSMDELAADAGVSRGTLYRLFPGKPALFRELIQAYSPWEAVADVIDAAAGRSPEQVMPEVGRALAGGLSGRTGLLLRMVFEMVKGEPDTTEGVRHSMGRGLPDLIQYLSEQMAAGRIRRMHPILALQLLAGPIVAHSLTRPLAALIGFEMRPEQVVDQIVAAWLRAMAPDETK